MSKNNLFDPCIGLCKFDPVTGYCYGCACTLQDRNKWKDGASDTWKSKNLHDIKRRLSNSWPLNSWLTNYKYKQEKGESLFEVGEKILSEHDHDFLKPESK
jgi:hypothetical protein